MREKSEKSPPPDAQAIANLLWESAQECFGGPDNPATFPVLDGGSARAHRLAFVVGAAYGKLQEVAAQEVRAASESRPPLLLDRERSELPD